LPKIHLALAKKAVELKKSPESLDTLAVAYAANGNFIRAIECDNPQIIIIPNVSLKALNKVKITGISKLN